MMNKILKTVIFIMCIQLSLSMLSCGEAWSVFKEKSTDIQNSEPEYDKKWSIYIYLVGSNLEDRDLNQLSKLTSTLVEEEAKYEESAYEQRVSERAIEFSEEVAEMGMTLPNVLYNKSSGKEEETKNTDSDAMGYATYNIETILGCDIPDNMQIVIQTGGARRWQTSLVNPNRSQRFLIDSDGFGIVYDEPVVNMANPDTLEEFMIFCKEYYPAENEIMLFWDHGGAYAGFGVDEIYGEDMLTVREMVSAFENVRNLYNPDEKLFDCIAYDACIMGNLETARLFSDYADYYLSSAEEMSGLGWGYEAIINALYENPEMSVTEFGETVAKANVANVQIDGLNDVYPAIYSVYDLSKIENVYTEYAAFIKQALKDSIADVSNLTEISRASSKTLSYCYGNSGGYNLIDLGDFVSKLSEKYPEQSKKILNALDECIICKESTTYFRGASGMSVYFPAKMTGFMSLRKYLQYTIELSDNPDIDALNYYKITGCLNEELLEYVDSQGYGEVKNIDYGVLEDITYLDVLISEDGNYSAKLSDEQSELIQSASLGLVYVENGTDNIIYFGEFKDAPLSEDGTAESDFTFTMASLEGNELPCVQIGEDDETVTYRVPIMYYGVDAYMLYTMDKETREYTIIGFTLSLDNGSGTTEREVIEFDEGDEFSVVYRYGSLDNSPEDNGYATYVYSDDMKIEDKVISDGDYYSYIMFTDIRSDLYYTAAVAFTVSDGKITDEYVDRSINMTDYIEE